jgi:hypothetical protein
MARGHQVIYNTKPALVLSFYSGLLEYTSARRALTSSNTAPAFHRTMFSRIADWHTDAHDSHCDGAKRPSWAQKQAKPIVQMITGTAYHVGENA